MAKCKLCKTNLPDGTEYCNDCQGKREVINNESYLDSLLSSVKNSSASAGNNYIKNQAKRNSADLDKEKQVDKPKHTDKEEWLEQDMDLFAEDNENFTLDPDDIKDFEDLDLYEDLDDTIVILDEDLFGSYLSEEMNDHEATSEVAPANAQERSLTDEDGEGKVEDHLIQEDTNEQQEPYEFDKQMDYNRDYNIGEDVLAELDENNHSLQEEPIDSRNTDESFNTDNDYHMDGDLYSDEAYPAEGVLHTDESLRTEDEFDFAQDVSADAVTKSNNLDTNIDHEFMNNDIFSNNLDEHEADDSFDTGLGELLNGFDLSEPEEDEYGVTVENNIISPKGNQDNATSEAEDDSQMASDDILSILNQFNSDDPITADVQEISNMLSGAGSRIQHDSGMPGDVGEVFSDALKAVSSLSDMDSEEELLLSQLSGNKTDKKGKKGKEANKADKPEKQSKKVKGKGFFGILFGNVIDANAKKTEGKAAKDESAEPKDSAKAKKASKKKKGAPEGANSNEENSEGAVVDKQSKKAEKLAKKLEKKEKKKNVIQVIEEIEEEEGRINRLGASVVFVFFGILVMLLIIGTNIFAYSLSVKNAKIYFDRHKYTEAYNEVYGIDIKDEDIGLYDKIMTVMYVNKQLNSYNNYYAMKKYPEALDSLLKGLSRYDKYIELATMLGINTDLDYVREQIIAELDNVFHLSEEAAMGILKNENQAEYSIDVYDVVLENIQY